MTPSEELDKMVNELDRNGHDTGDCVMEEIREGDIHLIRPVLRPQPPIMISVPLKEWSDLHRRNGFLEGVMASVAGTDGECWIKDPWTYYQRVMLGMPVVVEKEP